MENKIVVVDDEPMMIKALKRLFMDEPFEFYGFDSPQKALEHLDRIAPQVVLSDQRMPEMEGTHFLGRVREKHPDTVRMILTGFCVPDSAQQAIQRGDVSAIMLKPWDDKQLVQTIHEAFHHSVSIRKQKVHLCDICSEKVSFPQIRIHDSIYMCPRCKNWYELLPGVLIGSLRRMIIGNVL